MSKISLALSAPLVNYLDTNRMGCHETLYQSNFSFWLWWCSTNMRLTFVFLVELFDKFKRGFRWLRCYRCHRGAGRRSWVRFLAGSGSFCVGLACALCVDSLLQCLSNPKDMQLRLIFYCEYEWAQSFVSIQIVMLLCSIHLKSTVLHIYPPSVVFAEFSLFSFTYSGFNFLIKFFIKQFKGLRAKSVKL